MTFYSTIGKNMILPQDVLIQSKETQEIPGSINATIGMATENGKVMKLNSLEDIIKNVSSECYLPYSPTPGTLNIRQQWKDKILKENKNLRQEYLSQPIATTGITQGIDIVANLFSEKGDALILPNLFWQNYAQIYNVKLGVNIYTYDQFNNENKYNLDAFKNTLYNIKENKIHILLNFPNNPTGYTPSREEFKSITEIIENFLVENENKSVILLCDDAYFGLFFEENNKNSTINCLEKLVNNENCLIIKIDGVTKEYYAWGLRLGFITYYIKDDILRNEIMAKTQGYIRSSTSSGSTIAQIAIQKLLSENKYILEKENNDNIIKNRYITLKQSIEKENLESLTRVLPFNSGYFFTIELPKEINAHEFRLRLLEKYKLGIYSMDENNIRIAFSCLEESYIPELVKNIKNCIIDFKNK